MATLSELTVQIVAARSTKKDMTLEELQVEMTTISNMIKAIEEGTSPQPAQEAPVVEEPAKPQKLNLKKVIKDKEVICLICNQGFTTLKRHLAKAHQLTDREYKKQFGIPASVKLVAKSYSEMRKKAAVERGLGDLLVKARETRMKNLAEKKANPPKKKVVKKK